MKKQSIALIILLVLLFSGAIYIYSQNGKAIICFTNTTSSAGAIDRIFEDNSKRKLWIPTGATEIKNDEFTLDECKIKVVHSGGKSNSFSIKYKDIECKSFLLAYPSNQENIILVKLEIPRATNLLTIVNNYFKQKHIETTTNKFLQSIHNFFAKQENIYGTSFQKTILKDSTLVSLKVNTILYPTVAQIYASIDKLKDFAKNNDALQINPPMLNVLKNQNVGFTYMVALPVNKFINISTAEIMAKRMLVGGNIIESAKIMGGELSIEKYLKELENFKFDNAYISPAIPYQSLITDRRVVSDTSKWETKLYYPIF